MHVQNIKLHGVGHVLEVLLDVVDKQFLVQHKGYKFSQLVEQFTFPECTIKRNVFYTNPFVCVHDKITPLPFTNCHLSLNLGVIHMISLQL